MTSSPRIVAIVAARNEEDLAAAVIGDLVGQGIEVYLLDDGSTDRTLEEVRPFLGAGLLGMETLSPSPGGFFSLRRIVARKGELARELGADWYLNADADEFRESPWGGLSLRDGIALVDRMGFDAIDFEPFDFRPTDDRFRRGDPRPDFPYCEPGNPLDRLQIRCWKPAGRPVDLVSSGGHEAVFPGRRVFPIRFLLRHYPFRSQAQAERKLFGDRRPRYDPEEEAAGWHRQYASIEPGHRFVRDPSTLVRFDPDEVRARLAIRNRLVDELEGEPVAIDLLHDSLTRERDLLGIALDDRNRAALRLGSELDEARREATRQHDEGRRLAAELDARNRELLRLREEIDDWKRQASEQHDEGRRLAAELDSRNRELEEVRAELGRARGELAARNREADELRERVETAEAEIRRLQAANEALGIELWTSSREGDRLRAELDERRREVDRLLASRDSLAADLAETRRRLDEIVASASWRWTAPARALLRPWVGNK